MCAYFFWIVICSFSLQPKISEHHSMYYKCSLNFFVYKSFSPFVYIIQKFVVLFCCYSKLIFSKAFPDPSLCLCGMKVGWIFFLTSNTFVLNTNIWNFLILSEGICNHTWFILPHHFMVLLCFWFSCLVSSTCKMEVKNRNSFVLPDLLVAVSVIQSRM